MNFLRKLCKLKKHNIGSVYILTAFALPLLVGVMGLAVEGGNAYSVKVRNQTVADLSALAAAENYLDSRDDAEMSAAARAVAFASNIPNTAVEARIVTSPDGSGEQVVRVDITTFEPLFLSQILTTETEFEITSTSFAKFTAGQPPCVVALGEDANPGISVIIGSQINAADCEISSNGNARVEGGSQITAETLNLHNNISVALGSSLNVENLNVNQPVISDPLAGNTEVTNALSRLGVFTPVQIPVLNFSGGQPFNPSFFPLTFTHSGRSGVYNSTTREWRFPQGTYNISNLTVAGGQSVIFADGSTLNISGNVTTGQGLDFGNSNVFIRGNLTVGGGSFLRIGNGRVSILGTTRTTSDVSIGNGRHFFGPIIIGAGNDFIVGNGNVDINGLLEVGGSSTTSFGRGNFAIGVAQGVDAITIGGNSSLLFSDGRFSVNGNIRAQGSAEIRFGATPSHFINGSLILGGNTTFGAGAYFINGDFTNTITGAVTGTDVSFTLAGSYIMAGSSMLNLVAATAGSTSGAIVDFLIITQNSADTLIEAAANSVLTGIIYVPNSRLLVQSGGTLGGTTGCWSLVADTIEVQAGAIAQTSVCDPLADSNGSGGSSVGLLR